ncbi:MAG: ATP-binding cassette domain-containing protein [Cyanobacteria bacterium SZAS LIN-5]|nr:ATP-binding cassette domain-containing protein [Cyanobacteria bacterium SZAS LIN-5]RTL45130.1 MAG: ATP-binding cassette domain-containing protein [Candidatus Melainabacteria bacterium]
MKNLIQQNEDKKQQLDEPKQAQIYWRLLQYIKPYSLPFFIGMVAAIPSGSMDGIIAWLAGEGIQRVFMGSDRHLIYYVPLVVLGVVACQGIFRFIEAYTIRLVGSSAIRDLRNEMFCHLEKQPLLFFQSQSSGIMIGRMTNDIGLIENAISQTFQSMISRTITVISLATVLILQSWMLSIIALGILSLIVVPVSIFGKKIRKSSRGGQEAIGDLVSVLSESIQGAKIVQSYNLEDFQTARFLATNQSFQSNTMKAVRSEAVLSPILAMIGALGIASVMWVAGYQIMHKHMELGALTSFVIALLLLYSPIKNIGRINGILQPALAAAQRVFEVLDTESNLTDAPQAIELKDGMHRIKFEDVYFQYPGHSNMVLKNVNLEIPPGMMVALVGLSGSGKSTMANLVPRFFDVTSGQLSIDGIPIREISLRSLRSKIALVTQDNFLFNTTVEENIRLGKLDATQEELESASKAAYCHDFILELKDGYKTMIGERGVRLSGGQQQRLAIARAFLKNAPILILDEATSSLDNESEAMVQKALNHLMEGRTVIVIAHRLSTVRHADQIVVLEDGQIVETGTHQSLLDADKHYARLLKAQFERPALAAE